MIVKYEMISIITWQIEQMKIIFNSGVYKNYLGGGIRLVMLLGFAAAFKASSILKIIRNSVNYLKFALVHKYFNCKEKFLVYKYC